MPRHTLALAVFIAALVAVGGTASAAPPPAQAVIEQRSERVMPFDMKRSTHMFRPTPSGGVQTVVSTDGDRKQVALVRAHLRSIASSFARGDFADPVRIHGASAPGLAALRRDWRHLRVSYADVRNGGAVTFGSTEPTVISAIHAFFAMQVRDHGQHAKMMPGDMHMNMRA